MEHPSERGLTLHLSWTAGPKKHAVTAPLGPLLRVAAIGALCAASYAFGVWRARLEQQTVAAPQPLTALKAVDVRMDQAIAVERTPVITPLNAMDPSALVMGPSASFQPEAKAPEPVPVPIKPWRRELLKSLRK